MISIFGQTNVYHPFPDSNAMWTDRIYDPLCNLTSECSINQYRITGDTVIDGKIYKKLTKSGYLVDQNYQYTFYSEYAGAFRQEINNKKVYYYPPYSYPQADTLLYDFNLEMGDSLPLSYLYPINFCDAVVDTIDSVMVGDSYRKRFHLSTNETPPWGQTWLIEGIGTTHGLFGGICAGWEGWQDLTCFIQDDSISYPTPSNSDCDLITSIAESGNHQNSIHIYPNPAIASLTIEIPLLQKNTYISILNLNGEVLIQSGITDQLTHIDITGLQRGIFFVRLTDDQHVEVQKLIKE